MSLLQVTQFTEKWYFCLHFFASKCRQLLVTFAEYFVLQNGFNSSQSSQLKWKRRKSMNEMNVWQNFTFPWGKPTAAIINKKTSLLSIRAALDRHLKAPKSFKNMSLFYFIFSNNHQCNYTKTIGRLRRARLPKYSWSCVHDFRRTSCRDVYPHDEEEIFVCSSDFPVIRL